MADSAFVGPARRADLDGHWRPARITHTAAAAVGVRLLTLSNDRRQPVRPGSHVLVRVGEGDSSPYRCYSIVSAADDGRSLTIAVRLNEGPAARGGSRYMHALETGSAVRIAGPRQTFPLGLRAESYVLVAGGIGITAIAGMARVLRRMGRSYRLYYTGRSRAAMPFLAELQELHGDNLHVVPTDERGRLDVSALVSDITADSESARTTELYCCGPLPMMDEARRAWAAAGLPVTNLRFETFANSGHLLAESFRVRIPDLGATIDVPPEQTMLQALLDSGVEVMSDCVKGECGLCVVRVSEVSGHLDHRDVFLSDEQKQRSRLLCACVSRVAAEPGQVAAITIDAP